MANNVFQPLQVPLLYQNDHFDVTHPSLPTERTLRQLYNVFDQRTSGAKHLDFNLVTATDIEVFKGAMVRINICTDDQNTLVCFFHVSDEQSCRPIEDFSVILTIETGIDFGFWRTERKIKWGGLSNTPTEAKMRGARQPHGLKWDFQQQTEHEIDVSMNIKIDLYTAYDPKRMPTLYGDTSTQDIISKLFLKEEESDFKIVSHDRTFPCHKLVLCGQSDVFSAMLNNDKSLEVKEGQVDIKDFSSKTTETLLKYMYQSKVESQNIDVDLLMAADKYY